MACVRVSVGVRAKGVNGWATGRVRISSWDRVAVHHALPRGRGGGRVHAERKGRGEKRILLNSLYVCVSVCVCVCVCVCVFVVRAYSQKVAHTQPPRSPTPAHPFFFQPCASLTFAHCRRIAPVRFPIFACMGIIRNNTAKPARTLGPITKSMTTTTASMMMGQDMTKMP